MVLREVHRPSASGISRALTCGLSAVLPWPPEAPKAHNAPAPRGDRIHAAIQRWSYGARKEDVLHPLLPYDCPNLYQDILPCIPIMAPIEGLPVAEVECWLNPLTRECMLGTGGTPRPDGYWRGMTDRFGMYEHPIIGTLPAVMDYKTGNPRFQVSGNSDQNGYFALWLASMLDVTMVASIVFLTQQPQQPRLHIWDEVQLNSLALRLHAHEARLCLLERNAEMPEPVKSKECTFCPAKPVCPLWAGKEEGDDERVFVA